MRYVSHRFGHPEEFRAEYAKANRLRKLATMVLLKVGNEPHVQVCAYVHTSLYKYIYIYIYIRFVYIDSGAGDSKIRASRPPGSTPRKRC